MTTKGGLTLQTVLQSQDGDLIDIEGMWVEARYEADEVVLRMKF